MITLAKLQADFHEVMLNYRRLDEILKSNKFERLWEDSIEKQRIVVRRHIMIGDRARVLRWIKKHPSLELGEKTLMELKDIAKRESVRNYSRLSKPELVKVIKECEDEQE